MNDRDGINACKEFIKERLADDNPNGIVLFEFEEYMFSDFVDACIEMKSEIISSQVLFIGTLTNDQAIELEKSVHPMFTASLLAEALAKKLGNGKNPKKVLDQFIGIASKKLSSIKPQQLASHWRKFGLELEKKQ